MTTLVAAGQNPQRIGGFITTFTGRHFYPIDPRPADFHLADVVQGLSHENRANGQTILPMPVAQHCVHVARILRSLGFSARIQMIGLTHDVSEAYIKDMPSPLKEWLPDYKRIEEKVQAAAYVWAGLGEISEVEYEPVNWVDKALFPVEAKFFMPNAVHPIDPMLADYIIEPWTAERAREEYVNLFNKLKAEMV